MLVCHTMRIALHSSVWLRVTTFLWVSSWMVLLPLVHVHPEVEHHHGDLGHIHHTVMHTVFSGAPESEDISENTTDVSSLGDHHRSATISMYENTTSSQSEYPLIAAFIAPTIQKLLLQPSSLIEDSPSAAPKFVSESTAVREVKPSMWFLSAALPLRAPPSFLS